MELMAWGALRENPDGFYRKPRPPDSFDLSDEGVRHVCSLGGSSLESLGSVDRPAAKSQRRVEAK